jgi:hypothetical protein
MHLNRTDMVIIVVGVMFLAWGVIYLATYEPFVKDMFPMRFEIRGVENTTTGDSINGLPDLSIYIQNVGGKTREESVQFETENCLSIDGVPITGLTIDPPDGLLEARGEIATITIPGGGRRLGEQFNIRLVSVDNWGFEGPFWVGWDTDVDGNAIS